MPFFARLRLYQFEVYYKLLFPCHNYRPVSGRQILISPIGVIVWKGWKSRILSYRVLLELYPFKFDPERHNTLNDYKRNITNNLDKYESFSSQILKVLSLVIAFKSCLFSTLCMLLTDPVSGSLRDCPWQSHCVQFWKAGYWWNLCGCHR